MYKLEKFKKIKGLVHGISTKADGNMSFNWGKKDAVIKNRKRFLKKLDISPDACVNMQLEHNINLKEVDKNFAGQGMFTTDGIAVDVLVTREKNLFLFVLTADCLPIIFYDPKKQILALAHLGWKNTDKKFCEKIVKVFQKYDSKPVNIIVGIGPGIHKESYVLDKAQQNSWGKYVKKLGQNRFQIDLIGYNKKQLLDPGIKKENIEISSIDTAKSKEFFSHYRTKKTKEHEARFATIIGMI